MEKRKKWWIGVRGTDWNMIASVDAPEGYGAVIGPFRTKRGATYMLHNRWVETVAEAERLAKELVTCCSTHQVRSTTSVTEDGVTVEGVPCYRCTVCEEIYFSFPQMQHIDKLFADTRRNHG